MLKPIGCKGVVLASGVAWPEQVRNTRRGAVAQVDSQVLQGTEERRDVVERQACRSKSKVGFFCLWLRL